MKNRILIVDDDRLVRRALGRVLKGAGWEVVEASSEQEAEKIIGHTANLPNIVLTDLNLGEGGIGLHVIDTCREYSVPVVLMSGNFGELGGRPDGVACVDKPVDTAMLVRLLAEIVTP